MWSTLPYSIAGFEGKDVWYAQYPVGINQTDHFMKARYILASFPGPKRRERAWFQPFVHALNYLGYHHVLISGRVPMTPSKSHG